MKKTILLLAATFIAFGLLPVRAQFGSGDHSDVMAKVFGTNLNFSATMETQIKMMPKQEDVSMSGKMYFAGGNSRSEMDTTSMIGGKIPPSAIAQMKAMGMDKIVSITRLDKKVMYMIYPGLQSYAQIEMPGAKSVQTNDYKVITTELGKETVDGHPCVKNQSTVSNAKTGQRMIMVTWNATDLKNCPVKIEQSSWTSTDSYEGTTTTMHFTNINLAKPDAGLFQPPSDYKKYDDLQTMMRDEMMKKMGNGANH